MLAHMYMDVKDRYTYISCISTVPYGIPINKIVNALAANHALHLNQNET